jgi:hypothetical protein
VCSPGDADAGTDGQPLEAPADVGWRLIEFLFDGTSPLAEVGPALVVDGMAVRVGTRRHSSTASRAVMLFACAVVAAVIISPTSRWLLLCVQRLRHRDGLPGRWWRW